MTQRSKRQLPMLLAGSAVLVVAAVFTTHRMEFRGSEPAVVATTTPPLAAHAPTTGTQPVMPQKKQSIQEFLAQAKLDACASGLTAVQISAACRDDIADHARHAGYTQTEIDTYLSRHQPH